MNIKLPNKIDINKLQGNRPCDTDAEQEIPYYDIELIARKVNSLLDYLGEDTFQQLEVRGNALYIKETNKQIFPLPQQNKGCCDSFPSCGCDGNDLDQFGKCICAVTATTGNLATEILLLLDESVEKWSKQGRTEDQIWAVKNYLTGAGGIEIDEKLTLAKEKGYKKGITDTKIWNGVYEIGAEEERNRIIKIVEETIEKGWKSHSLSKDGTYYKGGIDFLSDLLKKIRGDE